MFRQFFTWLWAMITLGALRSSGATAHSVVAPLKPEKSNNHKHSVDHQQRASPAEIKEQIAKGMQVFPHDFLKWERDSWILVQEQGALLRAERLDAISCGDMEAELNLAEALQRNSRMHQVLQERLDELWTLEAQRTSQPTQSSHLPPVSTTVLRDFPPSFEPERSGSAVEVDPPLHSAATEGVCSLPGREAVQVHELLDKSEPLGVRQASHEVHRDPHLRSVRDLLESALEADSQVHNVVSDGVRTRTEQLATSGGVRSHSGRSKVPRDLPHFRGDARNSIKDPLEFMDRFETVCEPNGLEDEQLVRVLPICLDQVDGAWFKMWRESNLQADWQAAKRAFMGHFRHPNELTVLQAQIQALKMDSSGVQRYADQFRKLMAQLGWTDKNPMAIYQFKQGLTRGMLDRLSGAEANLDLIAGFTGNPDITIGVDALVSMVLRIEADRALNIGGETPKVATVGKLEHSHNGARRETRTCNHCGRVGHIERDCHKKKAEERAKGLPAKMPGTAPVKGPGKCFNCGELGHYSNVCPKKKRHDSTPGKSPGPSARKTQVEDGDNVGGKRVSAEGIAVLEVADVANRQVACLHTPCYLEGEKVLAFVDGGANISFVDRRWVQKRGLTVEPRKGTLTQLVDGSTLPRVGVVCGLCLENGKKVLRVDLEVADLSGEEEVIIGIDLFEPLGFQVLRSAVCLAESG